MDLHNKVFHGTKYVFIPGRLLRIKIPRQMKKCQFIRKTPTDVVICTKHSCVLGHFFSFFFFIFLFPSVQKNVFPCSLETGVCFLWLAYL